MSSQETLAMVGHINTIDSRYFKAYWIDINQINYTVFYSKGLCMDVTDDVFILNKRDHVFSLLL